MSLQNLPSLLQAPIFALQRLSGGDGLDLRPVLLATDHYRMGLEGAGLPTRPLDEMAELMAPSREEAVPQRIAAQAVTAVLRRHDLFPKAGEPLRDFFGRLEGLRGSLQAQHGRFGITGSLARLFLKPVEFLRLANRDRNEFPTYDRVQQIHANGHTTVFRAEDALDDRTVALKVYTSPERTKPLPLQVVFNELRHQAAPSSSGVVRAYNTGRIPAGAPFVSFEWMASQDLRGIDLHHHPKRNPISLDMAIELARRLIRPVADIHAEGIIHRDLKPANFVMDASTWSIKLTDFSLAVRQEEAAPERLPVGTSGFMPQEVYSSDYVDDPTRDVYSLGMTLLDFFGSALPSRLRSRMGDQSPAEKSALSELRRILGRAIDGKPRRRYSDVRILSEEFDRKLG
jgi:serine/threonine protein kinase